MIREICDVCKKNDVDQRFKIKRKVKYDWLGCWSKWSNIEICNECAEKLFGIASLPPLHGVPDPKTILNIKKEIDKIWYKKRD